MDQPLSTAPEALAPFVPKFPAAPAVVQLPVVPPPPFDPGILVAPALLVGVGLVLGTLAWILWRRSQRIDPAALFRVLGTQPETAGTEHVEFPPIDLQQPIFGDATWRAIRTHADDAAYLGAVEAVRRQHGDTGHPMALPRLLREMMAAERIGFREAILRLASQAHAARPGAAWSGLVLDGEAPTEEPDAAPDAAEGGRPSALTGQATA